MNPTEPDLTDLPAHTSIGSVAESMRRGILANIADWHAYMRDRVAAWQPNDPPPRACDG